MKNICTLKNFNLEICELMRNDDGCVSLFNSYIDKLPDSSGSMLSLHDSTVSHLPYRYSKSQLLSVVTCLPTDRHQVVLRLP